jgi:hypothetical protein
MEERSGSSDSDLQATAIVTQWLEYDEGLRLRSRVAESTILRNRLCLSGECETSSVARRLERRAYRPGRPRLPRYMGRGSGSDPPRGISGVVGCLVVEALLYRKQG